ncbi:hypothetical protein AF332_21225 [Sporosarcina globispora]|uniref:Uncharacterized protein n=1 Tax=Sporosarcina globispora TaxID=1459 RepID=A0A0M0GGT7_SPOGL|nr:hypothetical protein [Sporosarcina globispora]KON89064.1 hypothetical protein AF332_21225 [Sporosarcina globispora]
MENHFRISVEEHRLSAWIQPVDINKLDGTVSPESFYTLLANEKITFGVSDEIIQRICSDPLSVEYQC